MTFGIYDVPTGGAALWSETQSVTMQNGIYNVLLGSVTPLTAGIFSAPVRYLQVTVEGQDLLPRTRITATPYALQSERAFGFRQEMDTRPLTVSPPAAMVTVHVSFNQAFAAPPRVVVSPLEGKIGGVTFVAATLSNITSTGFDITFESNSGVAADGSSSFTYQALGN